jgi:hypothetical protein
MPHPIKVYVYLQNEGTDAWRPVDAVEEGDSIFRITSAPEGDEAWQFPSGSRVVCEEKKLSGGPALVAVRLAS